MATEPFLELKVNTDTLHFALELLRLAGDLRHQIAPAARRVEVNASEIKPLICRVFLHDVDITQCPRAPLEELNKLDESHWALSMVNAALEHRSSESFSFELRSIGGSHPLLVRLIGCSYSLYPLLEQVALRCHALWDGQLVLMRRQSHILYGFFQHIDARSSPWLSLLEQEFFGADYGHQAPSVQRTEREQASLLAQPHRAPSSPSEKNVDAESDAPLLMKEVGSGQSDQRPARLARQPREETRAKLAKLRELFDDKQAGRHPQLSWNVACQRVNIDLKTAEAYEPQLKAAWQQMDKTKR